MNKKRIAIASNYDIDTYEETFLHTPLMDEAIASDLCNLLNEVDPMGQDYYKVVSPDYVLSIYNV